jgi:hypothetical protein
VAASWVTMVPPLSAMLDAIEVPRSKLPSVAEALPIVQTVIVPPLCV